LGIKFEAPHALLTAMSEETGIALYRRFDETETAAHLDVSLSTMKRLREAGHIAYIRVSERTVRYFGFQILEYLLNSVERQRCLDTPRDNSNSGSTISRSKPDPQPGAEPTLTKTPGKLGALASAQRILKRRKSG